jgi:flagellar assembly factor FliW
MTTTARLTAGAEGAPVTTTDSDGPAVLRFTDGIPGFADAHGFVLSDLTDEGTFQLLTCVDDPDLSLVVTSPWLFFPDYAPALPDSDRQVLGIERPEDAVLFCTVIADDDTDALYLNLRAPFVANATTHAARQVVLDDDLPLRATVPTGG